MQEHALIGDQMLRGVSLLRGEGIAVVRSHHERWDGDGYPDGLAGAEIPLVARIVCCCDAFNAMTTNRSYRRARSVTAALDELEACTGSQFDPNVVSALTHLIRRGRMEIEPKPELALAPAPVALSA